MVFIKRKIVQHGNTSLTISLPISWARRFDLKKGDELDILEKEKSIIISTAKAFQVNAIELDISGFDEKTIVWHIQALYRSGYDEVKVIFGNHSQMNIIQRIMGSFIGYSIMEQKGNYCIIKTISQVVEQEFESALRRTFLVTLSMAESTYDAFSERKSDSFNSVMVMEETNNQLVLFCHRLLNKYGYNNYAKTTSVYTIISLLENIADNYRNMMKDIRDKNIELDYKVDVLEIFSDVNKLLRTFYDIFYKPENKKVVEMSSNIYGLFGRIMLRMDESTPSERYILYYLNIIRNLVGETIGSALALKL